MPDPLRTPHAGLKPPDDLRLEEEFRAPYAAWAAGRHPEHADALMKAVAPVLQSGVKAFGGANPGPLVESHARRLALDALGTYDPSRGALKTHLLANLQGLQRYAAKSTQAIKVPERVALERQQLAMGEAQLADDLGRPATTAELADYMSLPPARIAHIRGYRPGFGEGQVAASGLGDDDDSEPAVVRPDPTAAKVELIYHDLDPTNQLLVEHALGLHGRPRLRSGQIARKLGLSPGAVSQRTTRIQAMLDELDGVL